MRRISSYDTLFQILEEKGLTDLALTTDPVRDKARKTLDSFFKNHKSLIDITFVLKGGLKALPELRKYLPGNNILLYSPEANHQKVRQSSSHVGQPNPENVLLFVEDDMAEASTIFELSYFSQMKRYRKIFVYLAYGIPDFDENPILKDIKAFQNTIKSQ